MSIKITKLFYTPATGTELMGLASKVEDESNGKVFSAIYKMNRVASKDFDFSELAEGAELLSEYKPL